MMSMTLPRLLITGMTVLGILFIDLGEATAEDLPEQPISQTCDGDLHTIIQGTPNDSYDGTFYITSSCKCLMQAYVLCHPDKDKKVRECQYDITIAEGQTISRTVKGGQQLSVACKKPKESEGKERCTGTYQFEQ
jgi:hypothetical protein